MVYAWKLPGIVPVDAQTAGDELSRIYKRDGGISLKTVVDESRGKDAPLHGCFEWDDTKAAEKYRQSQAAHIIRSITVVTEIAADNGSPMAVRAFVTTKTTPNYEPIQAVISSPDKYRVLLEQAKRDMQSFVQKYSVLSDHSALHLVIQNMKDSLGGTYDAPSINRP